MLKGVFIILIWMVLLPFCGGQIANVWFSEKKNAIFRVYLCGLIICFAVFQGVVVTNLLTVNDFSIACQVFENIISVLAILGIVTVTVSMCRKKKSADKVSAEKYKESVSKAKRIENIVLWAVFGIVFLFQIIQSFRLTYPDGDDAYYVGMATTGTYVSEMFTRLPYTGEYIGLDTRHCLAPFSYFVSFLARSSGVDASIIAHSVLPVLFLFFTYGIYYLIAERLFKEKRETALFMLLVSALFTFGNYSAYSMETFLMTRIRQGKASLGSFAIPVAIFVLLYLTEHLDKKRTDRVVCYLLLACNGMAAALFTTMGNLIYPCLLAVAALCIGIHKKHWKVMIPLAFSCVPSVATAVLYLIIR